MSTVSRTRVLRPRKRNVSSDPEPASQPPDLDVTSESPSRARRSRTVTQQRTTRQRGRPLKKRTHSTVRKHSPSPKNEEGPSASDGNQSVLRDITTDIFCAICLDGYKGQGHRVSSTICGHVFCTDCINSVVESHKTCPICCKELTANEVHPLYL